MLRPVWSLFYVIYSKRNYVSVQFVGKSMKHLSIEGSWQCYWHHISRVSWRPSASSFLFQIRGNVIFSTTDEIFIFVVFRRALPSLMPSFTYLPGCLFALVHSTRLLRNIAGEACFCSFIVRYRRNIIIEIKVAVASSILFTEEAINLNSHSPYRYNSRVEHKMLARPNVTLIFLPKASNNAATIACQCFWYQLPFSINSNADYRWIADAICQSIFGGFLYIRWHFEAYRVSGTGTSGFEIINIDGVIDIDWNNRAAYELKYHRNVISLMWAEFYFISSPLHRLLIDYRPLDFQAGANEAWRAAVKAFSRPEQFRARPIASPIRADRQSIKKPILAEINTDASRAAFRASIASKRNN